jgi:MFS family permease
MSERGGTAPLGKRLGLTASATAAIVTVVAVGMAISRMPPLLSITLSGRGVSERAIGLLVSTIAVASLATMPLAPRLAARFGTARTIVAALLVAASLIPVYRGIEALALFFPLAFVYGACLSTVFVLSEAWINAVTDERHRGTVMGIYATVLSLGFASGPAILAAVGMDSLRPFLIGSAILFLATLPVLAARRVSPEFGGGGHQPFVGFLFAVPLATFGVFCFAMAESGGFAFLPLWGMRLGYEKATAPLFASAMTLGNVALQIPLGLLADRIDRRGRHVRHGGGRHGLGQPVPPHAGAVRVGRGDGRTLHGRAGAPRLARARGRPCGRQRRLHLRLFARDAGRAAGPGRDHGPPAAHRLPALSRHDLRPLHRVHSLAHRQGAAAVRGFIASASPASPRARGSAQPELQTDAPPLRTP